MFTKKGVDIVQVTEENHFDADYEFTAKQGFQVAFAFTHFFAPFLSGLDPSIGEIKFSRVSLGQGDNGLPFVTQTELESHPCTREELGLEESQNKKFMPIRESYREIFEAEY